MKRFLALSLAALFCVFAFAACGEQKTAEVTTVAPEAGSESDWDYINNKNELIVGVTYFAPMDYFENGDTSSELIGFDADLAREVAKKLGVNVKFQEINWDSKEAELSSKAIDCIWNGLTVTEERKAQFDFTYNLYD